MLDVYSGVVNMFWTHSPIYSERISFVGIVLRSTSFNSRNFLGDFIVCLHVFVFPNLDLIN